MPKARTVYNLFLLSVGIMLFPVPSGAVGRASFDLDGCAWNATHIVVVSLVNEAHGKCRVLESWHGDLEAGQTLCIPRLAICMRLARSEEIAPNVLKLAIDGKRLILFLRKYEVRQQGQDYSITIWGSARDHGELHVSMVWMEDAEAYAMAQLFNPGPRILMPPPKTSVLSGGEAEIKKRVREVIQIRKEYEAILSIENPLVRARNLLRILKSGSFVVRWHIQEALVDCGRAAIPAFENVHHDRFLTRIVQRIDRGPHYPSAGLDVRKRLPWFRDQVTFWQTETPQLDPGWANMDVPYDTQNLSDAHKCWHFLYDNCTRLDEDFLKPIQDLRKLWLNTPVLRDSEAAYDTIVACDRALESIAARSQSDTSEQ